MTRVYGVYSDNIANMARRHVVMSEWLSSLRVRAQRGGHLLRYYVYRLLGGSASLPSALIIVMARCDIVAGFVTLLRLATK